MRSFPWGNKQYPGEFGHEPSGSFDLCTNCTKILEKGLHKLIEAFVPKKTDQISPQYPQGAR